MNIYEKLTEVQNELKAPKNQYNGFGKYKYRSCEDILEGVKPLLKKHKLALVISDTIVVNGDRFYLLATGKLVNIEKPEEIINTCGIAREEESKKGMDGSQVTGASSSYARKYMLNGLFAIDDTKDSDETNTGDNNEPLEPSNKPTGTKTPEPKKLSADQLKMINTLITQTGTDRKKVQERFGVKSISDLTTVQANQCINALMNTPNKEGK